MKGNCYCVWLNLLKGVLFLFFPLQILGFIIELLRLTLPFFFWKRSSKKGTFSMYLHPGNVLNLSFNIRLMSISVMVDDAKNSILGRTGNGQKKAWIKKRKAQVSIQCNFAFGKWLGDSHRPLRSWFHRGMVNSHKWLSRVDQRQKQIHSLESNEEWMTMQWTNDKNEFIHLNRMKNEWLDRAINENECT
jgi:hypothetical protein